MLRIVRANERNIVKRALITGVSGQDGAYLARLLLNKGYIVYGTSRDHLNNTFENLKTLGIYDDVNLASMSVTDGDQVKSVLESCHPDEVYNLACQSSVGRSFEMPEETRESIVGGTRVMLDSILQTDPAIRFFNPASSEIFGETPSPATELTVYEPVNPYGEAKAEALRLVTNYRQNKDLFACSAILFNHESPLRPSTFVTRKIIDGAIAISNGTQEKLYLGNLDIIRDWGWAPEYVDAIWRMLQLEQAEDFILATGDSFALQEFVNVAFQAVGLNWKSYVETDESLRRNLDLSQSYGAPGKAKALLNWSAELKMHEVVKRMIDANWRLL